MIEFITISRRSDLQQQLAASIPLAVGNLAQWNLTVVDGNKFNLAAGYNHGMSQTRGEILIFVRDGIRLMGNPLTFAPALQAIQEPRIGFLGVAGTRVLECHGCWWGYNQPESLNNCRGLIFQLCEGDFATQVRTWPGAAALFEQVVVLNGALLMCHRRTFEALGGFDAQNYGGQHFYDIDITFRASLAKLENHAALMPLIYLPPEHSDPEWEAGRQVFIRKFGNLLPARIA